jgi:Ca-activated chloride channel family protein
MGKPTSRNKSGLYASKGPKDESASGYIARDVAAPLASPHDERYASLANAEFVTSASDPLSTFSIDVDTASYSNVRRLLLREHTLPPVGAVRTEELVNYFEYADPPPTGDVPFAVTSEVGSCPWAPEHRLVRIGVRGATLETVPVRNLVFLVDSSGSMSDDLPLVQQALASLTERLSEKDRVAIVVYAGDSGVLLPPTSGASKAVILEALKRLHLGGGTNGAAGIRDAYRLARENFVEDGVNRIVLATDGDFNVGVSSISDLVALVEEERKSGVFLSVLGFGTGNLNDEMMEQIADRGNGNYAYIDGPREAKKVLVREADSTLVTIAKDVKIQVEFDPTRVARHRLVGYENRVLADHEFADDRVDAGEIGAGHTVTALYEIEPVADAGSGRLGELRLRYKAPDGDASELVTTELHDGGAPLEDASRDLRFAAAVATLGQKLRDVPAARTVRYADIYALASRAVGADVHCERREFLAMTHAAGVFANERMPGPPPNPAKVCEGSPMPSFGALRRAVPYDWGPARSFALEVLRLLPPLLALPMFVLAFVRRTKSRRRAVRSRRDR